VVVGVVAWALSALWIGAVSYLVLAELGPARPSLRLACFLVLLISVTTCLQLLAGLLGLLKPLPIGVASAFGLLVIWAWPVTRKVLQGAGGEAKSLWAAGTAAWASFPAWLRLLSFLLVPLLIFRFTFLIWALPPFVWDSLTYHLPNVAAWTQAGRIFAVESPVNRMLSPANFEVFATWFTVFLHHDIVVEAAGLPAYALGVASVYALGRAIGLAAWSSWLAALGYATTPALLLAATGTKNDPIMAALFLFILAMVWEIASGPSDGRDRPSLEGGVLILLAVGLGFGTKAYMLQMLVGGLVILLLARRDAGAPLSLGSAWKNVVQGWQASSSGRRTLSMAVVATALVLGGFWYARNWKVTGNPLYPYGVQVGQASVVSSPDDSARVTWRDFATNMGSLLERLGDKRRRISPDLPETTGWGWVAYGLGMPALVWGLVRSKRQRILFVGFAIALVLIVQASPTAVWLTRFLTWVPALLCLSSAEAVQVLGPASRPVRWCFAGLFAAASALNVGMTLNYNLLSPDDFKIMLSRPALEREASALPVTVPAEYGMALGLVPGDAVLGYNVYGNGFTYPLYRADYSQRLAYVPIPEGSTCASIADAMEARGTRYLFVAPVHTEDWILSLLNKCANEQDVLRERVRGLYVDKRG
jgi:hypothetical protein